jgi:general secretion pathway protein F
MPAFAYRAVDSAGKAQRGVVEATNAVGARRLLRERQLLPVAIEATSVAVGEGAPARAPMAGLFQPKVRTRQLATLTRQLSTLISSDVHVEEALRLIAAQADSPAVKTLLLNVRGGILDGRGLAAAMADHPAAFPEFYRASVAAGEHSGQLSQVLIHLADFVEQRHRNQQKVQLALLYPALLAGISAAMMVLLLVYVVPDIVKVFVSRGAELPFLTRALIGLSSGFQRWGWLIAILVVGGIVAGRHWLAQPGNRLRLHRRFTMTQPIARFSRQHNAARFAASLATLVQSAVPLVDALKAAAAVTPNLHVRARALTVATRVQEGSTLRAAMAEADIFPSMLLAIVASGESSGRLGPALGRAAAELDRETEAQMTCWCRWWSRRCCC